MLGKCPAHMRETQDTEHLRGASTFLIWAHRACDASATVAAVGASASASAAAPGGPTEGLAERPQERGRE